MKTTRPSWASICRNGRASVGNRTAVGFPGSRPSRLGPSISPAAISPSTAGCRNRWAIRPHNNAAGTTTARPTSTCRMVPSAALLLISMTPPPSPVHLSFEEPTAGQKCPLRHVNGVSERLCAPCRREAGACRHQQEGGPQTWPCARCCAGGGVHPAQPRRTCQPRPAPGQPRARHRGGGFRGAGQLGQTVRSASVGCIRAARGAGSSPAMAPTAWEAVVPMLAWARGLGAAVAHTSLINCADSPGQ